VCLVDDLSCATLGQPLPQSLAYDTVNFRSPDAGKVQAPEGPTLHRRSRPLRVGSGVVYDAVRRNSRLICKLLDLL